MLAAASCSAKKLMACVRPGVEETCACFEPTRAFSRLDLPTFERPRKATSGTVGGGKWSGEVAERRNFGIRRIAFDCRRPQRCGRRCSSSCPLAQIVRKGVAGPRRENGSIPLIAGDRELVHDPQPHRSDGANQPHRDIYFEVHNIRYSLCRLHLAEQRAQ